MTVCAQADTGILEDLFTDDEVDQVAARGDQVVGGALPAAIPAFGRVDDHVPGHRYAVGACGQELVDGAGQQGLDGLGTTGLQQVDVGGLGHTGARLGSVGQLVGLDDLDRIDMVFDGSRSEQAGDAAPDDDCTVGAAG
jgi:hypothetical protein